MSYSASKCIVLKNVAAVRLQQSVVFYFLSDNGCVCVCVTQGMQIVVLALIRSIPPISSVAMFGLFEFVIFAIIGIQLFAGRLGACNQVVWL